MASRKKVVESAPELPDFVVAYNTGSSVTQVAALLGVAVKTARKRLVEGGATIRPVGRPRKDRVLA